MLMNKKSLLFVGVFFSLLFLFAIVSIGAEDAGDIDSAIYDAFENEDEVRVIVVLEEDISSEEILEMDISERIEAVEELQEEFFEELSQDVEVFGDEVDEEIELLDESLGESFKTVSDSVEGLVESVDDGLVVLDEEETELLEDVLDAEVIVLHEFEQTSVVTLEIDDSDVLDELIATGKVAEVLLDEKVSITLDSSVPLINANDVWEYDSIGDGTGLSITGQGETVCVIDTGIDYTHSALGACNPVMYSVDGVEEELSTVVESDHPYDNSIDVTYIINMSGYENIAAHFDYISLEAPIEGVSDTLDRVYVYNENNETIAVYKGNHTDIWTPSTSGSVLYIRLVTDGSVTDDGFLIDSVVNGITNTTMNWSDCSKVIGGYDIYNNDADPIDDNYHGTHVAGIIASDDSTYSGVAPGASLLALKALDSSGNGYVSDVAAAVEWCVSNSESYNVSIISMSLGDSTQYNSACDSLSTSGVIMSPLFASANAKNISVVVATGNEGYTSGINGPACVSGAIPVGSTTTSDVMSSFTNRGALLHLLAPGSSITSTYLGGGTVSVSGTSMATPHVAGTIALMKQYAKAVSGSSLSKEQIESKLFSTGVTIDDTDSSGNNYSRIDALAAIQPYLNFTTPSPISGELDDDGSFTINISSDIDLSEIVVEVDSGDDVLTNYTMTHEGFIEPFYYYSYSFTNLSTGNYLLNIYGADSLGTSSESESLSVEVDLGGTITISTPLNDSYYNSAFTTNAIIESAVNITQSNYTISNVSDNSVLQFEENLSVEQNSLVWNSLVDVTNSTFADGNYLFEVFGVDDSEQIISDSVEFIVDLTIPEIYDLTYASLFDNSSVLYTNDTIYFEVTVIDENINSSSVILEINTVSGLVNYSMVLVDSESTLFNFSFDAFNNLSGGSNVSFQVYANDLAGNEGTNTIDYLTLENYEVDSVNITSPENNSVNELGDPVTFTVVASDLDNDTLSYYWNFSDETTNSASDSTTEYTFISEGSFEVIVTSSDSNSSLDGSVVVEVNDSSAPNITSLDWDNYTINSGDTQNVTVLLEAFDYSNFSAINIYDTTGEQVANDDSIYNAANWSFGNHTDAGTYEFTIELIDNSSSLNVVNQSFDYTIIVDSVDEETTEETTETSDSGGGGGVVSTSSTDDDSEEESSEETTETSESSESDSEDTSSSSSSSGTGSVEDGGLLAAQNDNEKQESLWSRFFGGEGLTGAVGGIGLTTGNTFLGFLLIITLALTVLYFVVKPKGGY